MITNLDLSILDWIQRTLRCGVFGSYCTRNHVFRGGRMDLDPAGGGAAGTKKDQSMGHRGIGGAACGSAAVQCAAQAAGGAATALYLPSGADAAGEGPAGFFVPLRACCGVLCGGICTAVFKVQGMDSSNGAGGGHRPEPAVPLRPLSQRCNLRGGAGNIMRMDWSISCQKSR